VDAIAGEAAIAPLEGAGRGARLSSLLTLGAGVLIFAASLWLRHAFPVFAVGPAGHDDLLFVRLAEYLGSGQWLGPYDNLTHAKGAAYSAFLAANQPTGVPLKLMEHGLYLLSSLLFAATLGRVLGSRLATLVCFAALAFNPLAWAPEVGGRVVREGVYASLALLLLALAVRVFVERRGDSAREELRAKRLALVGLGLVGAAFWLTREEGAWMVPSLVILCFYWLVSAARRAGRDRRAIAALLLFLAIPVVSFALAVGAVNLANFVKYGVFRNNDFRAGDFAAAYGALARISHADWRRYVAFPRDAREKAYSVSAAARELRPFFEGAGGEFWRGIGCHQTRTTPCPEILAGWFMWALRDAVAAAGHYSSATEAQQFYLRLAAEVNDACDRGTIACGPPSSSMIPPWREDYLGATLAASRSIFIDLISLGDVKARITPSIGDARQLEQFSRVTNGPPASKGEAGWNGIRHRAAAAIAEVQKRVTFVAIPLAMIAWTFLLAFSMMQRRWHPGHVVAAALVAALAARVVLLGFLEATSIPYTFLYLSPVVPIALAFAPCIAFLALAISAKSRGCAQ
jgi:uncharacterized membrane protein